MRIVEPPEVNERTRSAGRLLERPPRRRSTPPCPLCGAESTVALAAVRKRNYFSCADCALAFLDPAQLPSKEEELAEYRLHRNDPADPRYRAFLCRLTDPLLARLRPGDRGLDFGCGPGPAVSVMLREQGFSVQDWDPFFRPDEGALQAPYDFITCTEAAEHFHHPATEFRRLDSLLRPGGVLGVMTSMLMPATSFADWHYIREITHVSFYRPETMLWLATAFGWHAAIESGTVVIFTKRDTARPPLRAGGQFHSRAGA